MRKLLASVTLAFGMLAPIAGHAQSAKAVASCGTDSLPAGLLTWLQVDLTGTLCAPGGSGGSGGVVKQGALDATAGTWKFDTPAGSNLDTIIRGPAVFPMNITPTDCSGTITTGGTAQNAIAALTTLHGFTLANVDASAGSGEPLWFSFTGTATAANGSYPLSAPTATTFANLSSYTTPAGFGTNHAVSILGATTGHKFSCTWW